LLGDRRDDASNAPDINQSLISKILSKNYDYLDGIDKQKDNQVLQGKKKNSIRDWPDLEAALFE
jgi:hypothetical protein